VRKLLLLAGLLLPVTILLAQTAGEITGEVTDPSGASAPNATITATNKDTNVARTTQTNSVGVYSFPAMIPGSYEVKAAAAGFDTVVKTGIQLQVQQTARVDFTLNVGQATQTVEVSASGELLSTENASVGTVIEQKRITELPLNGRNFFSLVALSPNVTYGFAPAAQANNRQGGTRSALTMSLSGARATWTNYTLDGVTNTDINFNLYVLLPSVEALQEFKVQQGIYSAEFGRESGQVNVSTRPGGNNYHGTVFDFLRNDALDAKNYDFIGTNPAKQPFRQNQYGFTLGGPVLVPKLFNGRNRLFFMFNYEALRARTTRVTTATTITQAMRNGDFSVVPTQLRDPLTRTGTGSAATATPFAGNQIPVSRFDRNSLFLLGAYNPLPNITQAAAGLPRDNYQYLAKTPLDKDQLTTRIDFNESANSQWFGRYSWTDESQISPGLTKDGSTLYTRASQWVVTNTRILSATKVNEARFGYNSLFNVIGQELGNVEDVNSKLVGFPVKVTDPASWGIPSIGLSNNLSGFGNATSSPFTINNKTFQGVDNFSWVIGKHSLRIGGEYRYNKFPQLGNEFPRGQFQFNGSYTGEPVNLSGGYSGADFLMGNFFRADIAVALANGDFRNSEWAGYVDDTWKVKPHVTINAGLRWEVAQPLKDVAGNSVSFQLNQSLPSVANVQDRSLHPVYVRTGTGSFYDNLAFRYTPANGNSVFGNTVPVTRDGRLGDRLIKTDYNNFAPRFGVAWSPNDKWSIRTGIGVFFSQESKNSIFDLNRGLGGRTGVTPDQRARPQFDYTNFLNPSALPASIPISLTWGADHNLRTTYSVSYILNVQRILAKGTTLEVGYAGSQSRKLALLSNENAPLPGTTAFALRAPYPEFLGIQFVRGDAIANYNGLAAKLTQRLGTNLSTMFSFTWSKSLDDASAIRGPGSEFAPQDMRCRHCEYGPSSFNVPKRFVSSILYTLPFGKGQRFLNHGGIADRVVGGWQLSTIFTAQNGAPLNTTGWDAAGTNFVPSSNRLNCTGAASYVRDNPTANAYLNVAAFANTVAGTYGTCGRNVLRGPNQINADFSVIKDIHITEGHALQMRAEMFNVANHVQWAAPNANWGNQNAAPAGPAASFGQIRGTLNNMRQIQIALKYNF
jgi:Carboxypeptidase regulatory-like domain